jgi:hypothetical protein
VRETWQWKHAKKCTAIIFVRCDSRLGIVLRTAASLSSLPLRQLGSSSSTTRATRVPHRPMMGVHILMLAWPTVRQCSAVVSVTYTRNWWPPGSCKEHRLNRDRSTAGVHAAAFCKSCERTRYIDCERSRTYSANVLAGQFCLRGVQWSAVLAVSGALGHNQLRQFACRATIRSAQ